jgi:phospholipid transport system substrate-binding protein
LQYRGKTIKVSDMKIHGIISALLLSLFVLVGSRSVIAAEGAADVVRSTSAQVLERLRAEKAQLEENPGKIYELINELVLPHFDFYSMSRFVLGAAWKNASDQQKQEFVEQFKTLLVRTYANALKQYSENEIVYHPEQTSEGSSLVLVRSEVMGATGAGSIPIQYRMHSVDGAWKVVDVSVDGVSLVSTYRGSFASEIRSTGLDKLIDRLVERNRNVELSQTP